MDSTEASMVTEEIDESFLVCSFCSKWYSDAKILPCLHSFCQHCLNELAAKNGGKHIFCPVCKKGHDLPGGTKGASNNHFVNELIALFKKKSARSVDDMKCDGCREGAMTTQCIDCAIGLCDICVRTHQTIALSKSHRLMSLDKYRSTHYADFASVQPPVYCSSHPDNQLKFYCDTCAVPICLECTAVDHRITEHRYRYVKEAMTDCTKNLPRVLGKLQEKELEAKRSEHEARQMSQSLETRFRDQESKLTQHIEETVEIITNQIRNNGAELLEQMRAVYKSRQHNLEEQQNALHVAENSMRHARDFAEKLLHYGNATQMMYSWKDMTSQIQDLLKVKTQQRPVENDYIEFQPSEDYCKTLVLGVTIFHKHNYLELRDVPEFGRIDEEISVNMTTMNAENATKRAEPDGKIRAEMKTPSNVREEVDVTDNKDGTHTLRYRGKIEGKHELAVFVHNRSVQRSPAIIYVVPKRGLLHKYGQVGTDSGQFSYPESVTVTRNGGTLVCDRGNNRLQLFSLNGDHKKTVQINDFDHAFLPYFATQSRDGYFFITGNGNRQVIICDENLKYIRCFGSGELKYPRGITISPVNGRLYVVDNGSHCVRIYYQDGEYIKSFGSQGNKEGELSNPWGISIGVDGNVIVADNSNHRMQVFDGDGEYLYSFGDCGNGSDRLQNPLGVSTDRDGNVYVCDHNNHRIQKYDSHGKYLTRIDTAKDGLCNPRGICITDDKPFGKVVVADFGNNCIKVFAQ
ncbi:E3 ubiquitin-protein ligase TRIM71-like [Saccoglossus kowalevskii]|uniref:Tripartite motif-containing protein 2-like n=1 Tax=Saccoglossus kowalevskii TaxID=10224 RepID=A0ABM0GXQ5_SACKO|nr:PREDICTED: tripartite motif-containing protein 2-like [Saccoglossus kowalevskii]